MDSIDEKALAQQIAAALDAGALNLQQGVAYQLQAARQRALARLGEAQGEVSPDLAWAGTRSRSAGAPPRSARRSVRFWLAMLAVVAGLAGYASYEQWHLAQAMKEVEDTDVDILTSDLPIDAYLDHGFHNWLKSSGE